MGKTSSFRADSEESFFGNGWSELSSVNDLLKIGAMLEEVRDVGRLQTEDVEALRGRVTEARCTLLLSSSGIGELLASVGEDEEISRGAQHYVGLLLAGIGKIAVGLDNAETVLNDLLSERSRMEVAHG